MNTLHCICLTQMYALVSKKNAFRHGKVQELLFDYNNCSTTIFQQNTRQKFYCAQTARLMSIRRNVIALDVVHQPVAQEGHQASIHHCGTTLQLAQLANCYIQKIFVDLLRKQTNKQSATIKSAIV